MDLKQSLQVVSRTGRFVVGYRQTLKEIFRKKPAVIVASKKASQQLLNTVKMSAEAVGVPLLLTDLTPAEIGLTLRKPFPASFIAVLDPGSSDIVEHTRVESSE